MVSIVYRMVSVRASRIFVSVIRPLVFLGISPWYFVIPGEEKGNKNKNPEMRNITVPVSHKLNCLCTPQVLAQVASKNTDAIFTMQTEKKVEGITTAKTAGSKKRGRPFASTKLKTAVITEADTPSAASSPFVMKEAFCIESDFFSSFSSLSFADARARYLGESLVATKFSAS